MKVNAKHTKEVEVEIDDILISEIVLTKFCEIFDLPEFGYIKDGNIVVDDFGWQDYDIIRKATDDDINALAILKKLRDNL